MIATTIEQSKKLMDLGLDLNSADMWYINGEGKPHIGKWNDNSHDYDDIPAWTLSALLEILRNYTDCNKLDIFSNRSQKWQITISYYDHVWKEHEEVSINLMESTYNTVVWLLDNNFYK